MHQQASCRERMKAMKGTTSAMMTKIRNRELDPRNFDGPEPIFNHTSLLLLFASTLRCIRPSDLRTENEDMGAASTYRRVLESLTALYGRKSSYDCFNLPF